jgi:hypothetical protein
MKLSPQKQHLTADAARTKNFVAKNAIVGLALRERRASRGAYIHSSEIVRASGCKTASMT